MILSVEDVDFRPEEYNPPALMIWSDLAPRLSRMLRDLAPLATVLMTAQRDVVHVIAIFLQLRPEATDEHEVAREICETAPKTLLRQYWPDAHEGLFEQLRKCGSKARPMSFYKDVNTCLAAVVAEDLRLAEELTPANVAFFRKAMDLDPLVAAAGQSLGYNIERGLRFDAVLGLVRGLGLVRDLGAAQSGLREHADRPIAKWVEWRLIAAKSPLQLKLPPGLRHIDNGALLHSFATKWRSQRYCAVDLAKLALGTHVFLWYQELGQAAVACFERASDTLYFESCFSRGGAMNHEPVRARILELLLEAGITAHPCTFGKAWDDLTEENHRASLFHDLPWKR